MGYMLMGPSYAHHNVDEPAFLLGGLYRAPPKGYMSTEIN